MEIIQTNMDSLLETARYTTETHPLYLREWLLDGATTEDEIPSSVGEMPGYFDMKAARMFDQYTRGPLYFTCEAIRNLLVLMIWLGSTYVEQKIKRAFDLLIIVGILPLVSPIMLFAALAIKLETSGPVIYRQERVGKWGRRFTCYKFRSMCINADAIKKELMAQNEADEVVFKMKRDPRITRVGRIIRKLSIDELPQVFNVLKGDMSIVGPRPPVPNEVEQYQYDVYRRLETIPGLTGLQQVSGRSDLSFKRWVELDVEYIQQQCLRKDIEILLRTIPAVLSTKGAY